MLLASVASAQAGCANPQTQAAMTECAGIEYRRADAVMTEAWKATNARMKQRDAANPTRGGGFGYAAALLESQRAWLRFRDTQCVVEGGRYAGGSMQPMVQAQCRTRLTRDRTRQLRDMMWQG